MKAFFEHFAAVLGALTLTLLMMSVAHEYGYFTVIGRSFQPLLTTSDYFANAVLWLPAALVFVLSLQLQKMYDAPDQKDENEAPDQKDEKEIRMGWKISAWLAVALMGGFFILVILTSTWPPSTISAMFFMIVVIGVWGNLWSRFYRRLDALGDDLNALYRGVVKFGPPFFIAVFLWGVAEASQDVERTNDPYMVIFKGRNDRELRLVLRIFERGLLMRNAVANRIEFHKWEEVIALEKVADTRSETLICNLTGFSCQPKPPAP
jgi:hypothetical protein